MRRGTTSPRPGSLKLSRPTPKISVFSDVSQDKTLRSGDLALSWNILDFGLSYVRARQAADQVLIAREIQRRTTHGLLEDVRSEFWRAASLSKADPATEATGIADRCGDQKQP